MNDKSSRQDEDLNFKLEDVTSCSKIIKNDKMYVFFYELFFKSKLKKNYYKNL